MTSAKEMNQVLLLQELLTPEEETPPEFGVIIKNNTIFLVQLSDKTYFDFDTVEECIAFLKGRNSASQNK